MRLQLHRRLFAAILVMVLLLTSVSAVSAQDFTAPPAETTPPTETVPETTPATEAPAAEESSKMVLGAPDPDSAIYQICDRLVQDMEARHLFVYHTGTNQVLYSKTTGNGKLFPASITKLFSTYVALQYLDPDTIITAGTPPLSPFAPPDLDRRVDSPALSGRGSRPSGRTSG